MALSEFRWNKKRKHYAYLYKRIGNKRKNLLISSKPIMIIKKNHGGTRTIHNIPLFRHPSINKNGRFYLIPVSYLDDSSSFDDKEYNWNWNINDKRKIKRIKKFRKHK